MNNDNQFENDNKQEFGADLNTEQSVNETYDSSVNNEEKDTPLSENAQYDNDLNSNPTVEESKNNTENYNSQYTYNNINPEPKNYYSEQKHYIPNEFQQFNQQGNVFYQPPVQPPKKDNGKKGLKIFAVILAAVVIFTVGAGAGRMAGLIGGSDVLSGGKTNDSLTYNGEDIEVNSGNTVKREDITPDKDGKYSASQVAKLVGESVVNIQVYSTTDEKAGATASGVILNNKGYIITNDHIYSEVKNAKFVVTTNDGSSYKASYVAGDQRSDIAVLKFDNPPKNLIAASFADSSTVSAGDDVIAIGSPYGLSGTVTKGIVSYPARRISFSASSGSDNNQGATAAYSMRVIQTDAALNAGNSGGALVNMYGQVIGISSSKIATTGYEGLCFAIPSNDAVKYAKSLVKNGVVSGRARLGITYTSISSATAVLNDIPAGLRVQQIDNQSELYSKGLSTGENGDIITAINGKKVTSSDIALDIIDDSSAGDEIELKVYIVKTKKTKTFKVKLLEDKSNTSYVNEIPKATTSSRSNFGNGSNGNNDNSDPYGYQSPFSFGN